MPDRKPWDLTSLSSLSGALEWLAKRANATVLVAIRPGDVAFYAVPGLEPMAAVDMIVREIPALTQALTERQRQREQKALKQWKAKQEEREGGLADDESWR